MSLRRHLIAAMAAGAALLSGACVTVEPPAPQPVTIVLVNTTVLDVRPNLYTSSTATTEGELFVGANFNSSFTDRAFPELRAEETRTLTLDCDQAAAIGSDAPVIFNSTALTTTISTDRIFLRQGTEYACGATIRLVYYVEGDTFRVRWE